MAKTVKTKTGKTFRLLMPHEKGEKYARELRKGKAFTNDGEYKKDQYGKDRRLSNEQRAYRSGYLDARKDEAMLYNWKKSKQSDGAYTDAQKKAYHSGRGYKLGYSDRRIEFKNEENKEAFRAGYRSVDPQKYPEIKSKKK